jgi:hypothetical protein
MKVTQRAEDKMENTYSNSGIMFPGDKKTPKHPGLAGRRHGCLPALRHRRRVVDERMAQVGTEGRIPDRLVQGEGERGAIPRRGQSMNEALRPLHTALKVVAVTLEAGRCAHPDDDGFRRYASSTSLVRAFISSSTQPATTVNRISRMPRRGC